MTHNPSYRRILNKMDYYNYQQGLIYRHLEQEKGWISHEEHCRSFILKALDLIKPSIVTVLGSGWLLELPVAELSERVDILNLVDIIHPPEVKAQTAGLKNVRLIEEDLTGGLIEEVWRKAGSRNFFNRLRSLNEINVPEYKTVIDPGLVISLNLLTQLETLPEKMLRSKCRLTEDDYLGFRKEIQLKHVMFLEKHPSVLISDITEIHSKTGGETYQTPTVFIDLPAGKTKEEWTWDFDLTSSDFKQKKSVLKVAAILL